MESIKAVKKLVAFLALLLVAGLGVLGYGLYTKAPFKGTPAAGPQASSVSHTGTAVAAFGDLAVPVPAGSRIAQMSIAGERVVLHLTGGGAERVLVLDPAQGKVAGSFLLSPEPAIR